MPPLPDPDLQEGINYWSNVPATVDGVLGGFGTGTLPRVDALGSRQYLMYLLPELTNVPSALKPISPSRVNRRTRALDAGAGVGRVSSDVLLYLFDDVVLLEPVENFIKEAYSRGQKEGSDEDGMSGWRFLHNSEPKKSVSFIQGPLQSFDPSSPVNYQCKLLGRLGNTQAAADAEGFDVVWCQWCLGHLNDSDLVGFLKRSQLSLRDPGRGLIVVKENLCSDGPQKGARTVFDEEDSSLTRSDLAWKNIFQEAGLKLIREQVQLGLPEGLYTVKMYALR